jgi:hypothetical protein
MSDDINTYTFLPWLRQGVANNISSADGETGVKLRAEVSVKLTLTGTAVKEGDPDLIEPLDRNKVALYGPGDIIGIESRAIIKSEPLDWITNFEPNYLPYIDFYDEDFPWRYTPAAPDTGMQRLRPWIMLVVLKEGEFEDGKDMTGKPLPYIEVSDTASVFPSAEQLWAWAHVHVNEDIVQLDTDMQTDDMDAVLPRFRALLDNDPDMAYSRIVCPRKLEPQAAYHAFLIPSFETGRMAGLGISLKTADLPAELHATLSAWASYSNKKDATSFPYYHRWYFRTGTAGDFEYLVRLLEPRPMDARVGRRDMDVQDPGSNISGITDPELGGILKLGGALQVPFDTLKAEDKAEISKYDNWATPYPQPFQRDLAHFINLNDDYAAKEAQQANQDSTLGTAIEDDPDPLITPPLYGRWHALQQRLLVDADGNFLDHADNWVHELNLDPRWRVAAGTGTRVIQDKQEEYMDAAWEQVGDVLDANRRIRFALFAREIAGVWYRKHLQPMQTQNVYKAMQFMAPMQKRVLVQGRTAYYQIRQSVVPNTLVSAPLRRMIRPRSRLMRSLPFRNNIQPDNLIQRVNNLEVRPAPVKTVPATVPTLDEVANKLKPAGAPGFILEFLSRYPRLQYLPLLIALLVLVVVLLLGLSGVSTGIGGVIIAAMIAAYLQLRKWTQQVQDAESVLPENQTPDAVDSLPGSSDFHISAVDSGFTPTLGGSDSPQASRYKLALRDAYELVDLNGQAGAVAARPALDVPRVVADTLTAINPERTIARLVLNEVLIPQRIIDLIGKRFQEAMAYPEIDIPMYKPLVELSSELFLPNINYIEQNTISLLETNQRFIESYMVGLNHEFARELLWREYPTDQRGSYFRQFWDASTVLNKDGIDEKQWRERLRDIPPLDHWLRSSELGDHDHREQQGDKEEELVLVIRGELLKKYPNAIIYAHRAKWQMKNGQIDNTRERQLDDSAPIENNIKTPLYEARVNPDIFFFGFDITASEACGGTGENPDDDPGWFFVIKERPGEPRFGLDIGENTPVNVWNDLGWENVKPGVIAGDFITIDNSTATIPLTDPHGDNSLQEKFEQYDEDKHLSWNKNMNAAQLAYILYQVPVLVAVHAAEMLPKQ